MNLCEDVLSELRLAAIPGEREVVVGLQTEPEVGGQTEQVFEVERHVRTLIGSLSLRAPAE